MQHERAAHLLGQSGRRAGAPPLRNLAGDELRLAAALVHLELVALG